MATGSFDGVDFEVISDPLEVESSAEVSIRHIPGGDNNYIDLGGQLPERVRYQVYTSTQAAWTNLKAKRGITGTLTTTRDGTVTATLISARRLKVWPGGQTEGSLDFVVS